ncbi:MAG: phenylalanine--tRNA ligase subunit alpha [Candidatus Aenigmatarchaeota archaeon]
MYKLTEEGKKYLKEGLPEKNLLKFIATEKSLDEVKKFPNSVIALGWAKRNQWIEIKNNKVKLTDLGKSALYKENETEKALKEIDKGGETSPESLKILLRRKLIQEMKKEKRIGLFRRLFKKEKEIKKERTEGIKQLTPDLIRTGEWKKYPLIKYDVTLPAPIIYPGKKQPYIQFIENMREKLIGLGFQEMKGPLVETSFWNFDALFQPQDHPARGLHDALYLKHPKTGELPDKNLVAKVKATHEGGWITESKGWGSIWNEEEAKKLLMRSHTTSVSARTLLKYGDKPGKYFTIDRNYRYDVIDAQHLMEFDQCEGIVVGENLTLRHLLGFLKEIASILGAEKVRFKPSYFPYTEPSCELYVYYPKIGWIECGGSGLFRPELLRPLGIEKSQVLAWGLGIGRLAMIKLGINDIRMLYSDDLEFLREVELVR